MDKETMLGHLRDAAKAAGMDLPEMLAPEDHDVVVGRMRLHYLDWGTPGKRPILFLHGGGLTCHTWDLVCLALRRDFHCLALDQRGHGDSEWSPVMDYGVEAHRGDIEGFVKLLGLDDFILVGMSLGGINSIAYAGRNAEKLRALVIVDVGPDMRFDGAQKVRDFMAMRPALDSVDDFIERARVFNPRRKPELLRRSLLHNLRETTDGKWTWKYDHRFSTHRDLEELAERNQGLWQDVPNITCPTLVVRGAQSDVFHDEDAVKLAGALPNGRWALVPNAGHTVQGDNPRDLVVELREFFGEIGELSDVNSETA